MPEITQEQYTESKTISTFSGNRIDVFKLDPDLFTIEDIAHGLSQHPRFAGQLPDHYSVAQHSINCFFEAPEAYKLEALMHDASEAFTGDIAKPIKHRLPDFVALEDYIMRVLSKKFGFTYPKSTVVKKLDQSIGLREYKRLKLKDFNIPSMIGEHDTMNMAARRFADIYINITATQS